MLVTTPIRFPLVLEPGTLLDVRFEVGDMPLGVEALRRDSLEPGLAQCLPQRHPGAVGRIERIERTGRRLTDEGEAAEAAAEAAFLVEPGCDIDRKVAGRGRLRQRPRDLESVDHAHRPVEPAAGRLGIGVGADNHRPAGVAGAAQDISGPVNARVEPRLGQPGAEPAPGFEVDWRERRPHHPGPAGAEFTQGSQIGDQPIAVDGYFDFAHVRSPVASSAVTVNSSAGAAGTMCRPPERICHRFTAAGADPVAFAAKLDHLHALPPPSRGAVAVNLAMGGSLDDFSPGIDFFRKLKENEPIVPKQTSYARVLSGEIPILFDCDFNAYRAKYKDEANVALRSRRTNLPTGRRVVPSNPRCLPAARTRELRSRTVR